MDVYLDLRNMALGVSPADLGISVAPNDVAPYGILMDIGYPGVTVTLVSFVTGDASLYLSTGGGIIGGGKHKNVGEAAKRFVLAAAQFTNRMEAVDSYPLPGVGRVRFYVLTPGGVLTAEASEEDLAERRNELSALFYAGHGVITELRVVAERADDRPQDT